MRVQCPIVKLCFLYQILILKYLLYHKNYTLSGKHKFMQSKTNLFGAGIGNYFNIAFRST